jgi:uncharacterized protein YcfJ
MRIVLIALILGAASCVAPPIAGAQNGPSWERLAGLPAGVSIHVNTKSRHVACKFKSAEADAVTCVSGGAKTEVFPRAEIRTVKLARRGRSILAGMGIGAAGGAIIGAASGRNGSFIGRGAGAAILAVPGALIGAIVGAFVDFTDTTVYRAT